MSSFRKEEKGMSLRGDETVSNSHLQRKKEEETGIILK